MSPSPSPGVQMEEREQRPGVLSPEQGETDQRPSSPAPRLGPRNPDAQACFLPFLPPAVAGMYPQEKLRDIRNGGERDRSRLKLLALSADGG